VQRNGVRAAAWARADAAAPPPAPPFSPPPLLVNYRGAERSESSSRARHARSALPLPSQGFRIAPDCSDVTALVTAETSRQSVTDALASGSGFYRRRQNMLELDNPPSSSRPRSIGRFEFFGYLSLVLFVCGFALVPERSHDPETPLWQIFMPILLIYVPTRAVLTFATARERQNWARWLYGAWVVLDVVIGLLWVSTPPGDVVFASPDEFLVFFLLASVAAVYFAFRRECAAWFHPQRLAAREIEP